MYWPWYVGAGALGAIAVLHPLLTGRLFGVSGLFGRALNPATLKAERELAAIGDIDAALMQETLLQFGAQATTTTVVDVPAMPVVAPRLSFRASWLFIGSVVLGGLISALITGKFGSLSMGTTHERFFGDGALMLGVLFGGGFLVGFGTQMTGGCTSGHGLSGCSRFQVGSLLATASFFGTGILASLLFVRVLS